MEIISEETGDSPKQVQRYIKRADLIPELLEKVDDGSMGFTPAVQIAYLKKKEQGTYFYIHCSLYNPYLNDIGITPTPQLLSGFICPYHWHFFRCFNLHICTASLHSRIKPLSHALFVLFKYQNLLRNLFCNR